MSFNYEIIDGQPEVFDIELKNDFELKNDDESSLDLEDKPKYVYLRFPNIPEVQNMTYRIPYDGIINSEYLDYTMTQYQKEKKTTGTSRDEPLVIGLKYDQLKCQSISCKHTNSDCFFTYEEHGIKQKHVRSIIEHLTQYAGRLIDEEDDYQFPRIDEPKTIMVDDKSLQWMKEYILTGPDLLDASMIIVPCIQLSSFLGMKNFSGKCFMWTSVPLDETYKKDPKEGVRVAEEYTFRYIECKESCDIWLKEDEEKLAAEVAEAARLKVITDDAAAEVANVIDEDNEDNEDDGDNEINEID